MMLWRVPERYRNMTAIELAKAAFKIEEGDNYEFREIQNAVDHLPSYEVDRYRRCLTLLRDSRPLDSQPELV